MTAVVPDGAKAGELSALTACQFQPFGAQTTYDADCATLTVPENWDNTASRLIALPVVRIRATGAEPAEPVFWLQGGPGEPNLSWEPPGWLLAKHDVVMVGYRGIEGSVLLGCPELGRLFKSHLGRDIFSDAARAAYSEATVQCAAQHEEAGVDLAGYTIPGVIEDVEAARKELGYDRINLFTLSYGTRIAQLYAVMHPESLHRLVLISVNTPGNFIGDPKVLDQLVRHISDLCAKDAGCSSRTDDLAQDVYDVNHNMPTRWLFLPIDPGTVRLGTHFMFLNNHNMAVVFDAYLAAAHGDASGLAMANLMTKIMTPIDQFVYGEHFSKGGSADRDLYQGIKSIDLGDSIMGDPMAEWGWPAAASWPITLIPPQLRELQPTDVEMLLVNGTIDFGTPPTALDDAKPYYHNAQMVLLPEFSHNYDVMNLQPEAFERLITSYYDTGTADASLFTYEPLSFTPGTSLTTMAKLLAAAIVVLPLVLVAIVAVLVRRRRRVPVVTT